MLAFFVFSNQGQGLQRKFVFSDEFVHVNVITYDGDSWIWHEYGSRGFECRVLRVKDAEALFRNLRKIEHITAIVAVSVQRKKCYKFKFLMPQACNNIMTQIAGVEIAYTLNPRHLYKRLLSDKRTNFEIMASWRRHECLTQTSVMTRLINNCSKLTQTLSANVSNFFMSALTLSSHKIASLGFLNRRKSIRMKSYDDIT